MEKTAVKAWVKEALDEYMKESGAQGDNRPHPDSCLTEEEIYLVHKLVKVWNHAVNIIGSAVLIGILSGCGSPVRWC